MDSVYGMEACHFVELIGGFSDPRVDRMKQRLLEIDEVAQFLNHDKKNKKKTKKDKSDADKGTPKQLADSEDAPDSAEGEETHLCESSPSQSSF